MNDSHREQLKQRLDEEQVACRKDIERLEVSAKPISPSNALGRLTRMDSMNDHGITKAALLQQRERLYKLEQAIESLDKPGFGDCTGCGQPIAIERLIALPESTRCVRCAGRV